MKICIIGAAGSGTSTIGRHISYKYNFKQIESDYYAWKQTSPPFTEERTYEEGHNLLKMAFKSYKNLVISGNIARWGKEFANEFDLAIFLKAPTEVRLSRIKYRERELYGERVLKGGDMYDNFKDFLWYAKNYDIGDESFRSLTLHKNFIKKYIKCAVLEVDTNDYIETVMGKIYNKIDKIMLDKNNQSQIEKKLTI